MNTFHRLSQISAGDIEKVTAPSKGYNARFITIKDEDEEWEWDGEPILCGKYWPADKVIGFPIIIVLESRMLQNGSRL